mgnify:FL=1|jgi:hypothetical protein
MLQKKMDFFFMPYNYSQNVKKHMDIGDKVENKWDSLRDFVWEMKED